MKLLSARRVISASFVTAASVAAFVAPSAANAALPGHCKGEATTGAGSSLQADAQAVWDPTFNTNKVGCTTGPAVKYNSIGSGAGYKEWNEKHAYGTVGFIGTDNTVNKAEKESVEKEAETGTSELLTVPVLQGAVAIVVHLPEGCTATSKAAKGRLGFDQTTLEGIYKGSITKWSELEEVTGAGNKLEGATCNKASSILPVVRKDGSGTTHILKKFLNLTDSAKLAAENGKEETWAELAEGSVSTVWPTAAHVVHATETTGPGLLKEVAAKAGSVGYANLADARNPANGNFTTTPTQFWVELESSVKSGKAKYADPSKNKESETKSEANCKNTEYTNGPDGKGGTFPPPSADSPWNEVTAAKESKTYALCGLTYDLVLSNYAAYSKFGGNANEAQTVKDFEEFVISKVGGGEEIENHDYAPLPSSKAGTETYKRAEEGIEKIAD